jgi:hypothetical protein
MPFELLARVIALGIGAIHNASGTLSQLGRDSVRASGWLFDFSTSNSVNSDFPYISVRRLAANGISVLAIISNGASFAAGLSAKIA